MRTWLVLLIFIGFVLTLFVIWPSKGYAQGSPSVPLCESIPAGANCGGFGNCRALCQRCESSGGIWTAIGCLPTDVASLVRSIFEIFSGVIGGLIFLCIIANGLKIMTAQGDSEAIKKSREAIISCIVGLLVLLFSILFLKIVGVDILRIPGWT